MTLSNSLNLWVYGALIFISSNSLCVTHWKLDRDNNKVVPIETQHSTKHLAAGSFLDDKQIGKDENENIISTLELRYRRSVAETETDSESIDKTPSPNENKICNEFPCDKHEERGDGNVKMEQSLNNKSRDKTLSKSDLTDDTDIEEIPEQPDYEKKPTKPPTKDNE